jgi:hypothetical protein
MECRYSRTKRRNWRTCLPKDTKMFLQSRRKNKILTAAIEVDEDYKRYRDKLEQQLESPSIEHDSK